MWPVGCDAAMAVTVDFDAEELWLAEDPANAARPGVLSQARYGARTAVPQLLEVFESLDIPATFFVCGGDAVRHPEILESVVAHGHEIGHHGYTHRSPHLMSREEEESELVRGIEVLRPIAGEVHGYRSPSWDISANTLDLLVAHGFSYASNMMDAVRPYTHPEHELVEIPVHWSLDDAPHFWFDATSWNKTMRSAREVAEVWTEETEAIHAAGGLVTLTVHPQIIGRPGRLRMLTEFLTRVRADSGVWFARGREIADAARRAAVPA
ncbi:polysaccharide deacetylase family protein [Streptomyces sp. NPDC002454]|uniref:polysaccharide deacetylase family protein n=1 Tax=unclassified Streptomyces TaxID=2593676 RepID=UPI00331FDFD4